jgi:pyruvate formate lyase activating enzyme
MNGQPSTLMPTSEASSAPEIAIPEVRGVVLDVQRSALHDGPGIRTTIFLKGCPLRCRWCHNPESWRPQPETATSASSPKQFGRWMSVEQVMEIVRRDLAFYRGSGGGITISGGEPTAQFRFCLALLRAARAEGISTCLDTSGACSRPVIEQLQPWVDLFLFDIKASGDERHRELTGVTAGRIRENLAFLLERNARIWLRCPLIPGINDSLEHLHEIARLSRAGDSIERVDILPYHRSATGKWSELGLEYPCSTIAEPTDEQKAAWLQELELAGARHLQLA